MYTKRFAALILISLVSVFSGTALFSQIALSSASTDLINETVFEVVALKSTKDTLSYERELPLHNIPFAERNDKYRPLGTAFAVSSTEFVTAAHVVNLENRTLYGGLFIRDRQKNVYEFDAILKYSNEKDFVVFTVKNPQRHRFLSLSAEKKPALNSAVYAVGNAYGEGIIIRNGTLTSMTPEDVDGRWDWLRFTAAASPGNSGGPLLNGKGQVIGIILRKSENENLNYALPVSLLSAFPDRKGIYASRIRYSTPVTRKKSANEFNFSVSLPMNYRQFREKLTTYLHSSLAQSLKKLEQENKGTLFPNGAGSLPLLSSTFNSVFPNLICENDNGTWVTYVPEKKENSSIGTNGYLNFGSMMNIEFSYFQCPDDLPLAEIAGNPKRFTDIYLKGSIFYRSIGNEEINITSFGEPAKSFVHTDRFGRKWNVSAWDFSFSDETLLFFSTPVPGGMVSFCKVDDTDIAYSEIINDLLFMTDYIAFNYFGTFKEWKEFLALKGFLPPLLSNFQFTYETDKSLFLKYDLATISYDKELQEISDDSEMKLYLSYFKENNGFKWGITGVELWENKSNDNYYQIFREPRPDKSLSDSYTSFWNKLLKNENPYNATPYKYENGTYIRSVHPKYLTKSSNAELEAIYTVIVGREGSIDDAIMKTKLEKASTSATISE